MQQPGKDQLNGLIGHLIAGYRLTRMLGGSGGSGGVFLGQRDATLANPSALEGPAPQAAITVLTPPPTFSMSEQAEFRARFRRDAAILQQATHAHLLPLRAVGVDEATGFPYLVSPYMEGGNLATRLAQGRLPLATTGQYLAQMADALDFLHEQGITHGDITPQHVLFDQQGLAYLTGAGLLPFVGLARGGSAGATPPPGQPPVTPAMTGAVEYMAPEQARGEAIGPASDMYSLGVVLYQMVTGRVPFPGQSVAEIQRQMAQTAPPPPRQFRTDLPAPAEVVLMRALAREPAWRLSSAVKMSQMYTLGLRGEWSDELRRPADAPPSRATMPPTPQSTPSPITPPITPQPAAPQATPNAQPTAARPTQPPAPQTMPPGARQIVPPLPRSTMPPITGAPPAASMTASGANTGAIAVPQPQRGARRSGGVWLRVILAVALVAVLLGGAGAFLRLRQASASAPSSHASHASHPLANAIIGSHHLEIATELPTSGADAALGLPTQFGVDLAVTQNSDLGNGYSLSVVHADDEGVSGADPVIGAANIHRLIADPSVVAIVGPFSSSVARAEIPIVNRNTLVMISPTNTNPGLTKEQYAAEYRFNFDQLHPVGLPDAYFRLPATDDIQGAVDGDIARATPISASSAYVVDDNTKYGKGLAAAFTQEFTTKGGSIVGTAFITSEQASSLPQLAKAIAGKNPGVVFYGGVTSGGGMLKKDLVANGYKRPIVGGDAIANDPDWLATAGSGAANTYAIVAYPDIAGLKSPTAQQFISNYKAAFPGKSLLPYSVLAYDAAMVEITALKSLIKAGKGITRAALRDAVAGVSYEGVIGHIAFDANGDNSGNKVFSVYSVESDNRWHFTRLIVV